MIEDREIDLTAEHKFYVAPWQQTKHYEKALSKISTGRYSYKRTNRFIDIDPILGDKILRKHDLPWVKKQSIINSDSKARVRKITHHSDDYMSQDFGCTLRSTSSNTLMFLGERKIENQEVIEEIFLETIGYVPFTALSRCMRCGAHIITPHNSIAFMCRKCENDSHFNLPWTRRSNTGSW